MCRLRVVPGLCLISAPSVRMNVKNCNIWKNSIKKVSVFVEKLPFFRAPPRFRCYQRENKITSGFIDILIPWKNFSYGGYVRNGFLHVAAVLFGLICEFSIYVHGGSARNFLLEDVQEHLENLFCRFPENKSKHSKLVAVNSSRSLAKFASSSVFSPPFRWNIKKAAEKFSTRSLYFDFERNPLRALIEQCCLFAKFAQRRENK